MPPLIYLKTLELHSSWDGVCNIVKEGIVMHENEGGEGKRHYQNCKVESAISQSSLIKATHLKRRKEEHFSKMVKRNELQYDNI